MPFVAAAVEMKAGMEIRAKPDSDSHIYEPGGLNVMAKRLRTEAIRRRMGTSISELPPQRSITARRCRFRFA